jgi:hypothetical protein
MFITAFTSAHHRSLSWARSIQSMPPYLTSCRLILISSHLHNYICNIQMRTNYMFRPFLVRQSSGWNTKLSEELYHNTVWSHTVTTPVRRDSQPLTSSNTAKPPGATLSQRTLPTTVELSHCQIHAFKPHFCKRDLVRSTYTNVVDVFYWYCMHISLFNVLHTQRGWHFLKLYNIFLLFYYWLLVSASEGHHQANIYKKKNLKNAGVYSTDVSFYGIPFAVINSLYNYYHLLNVLSLVSCAEILWCTMNVFPKFSLYWQP